MLGCQLRLRPRCVEGNGGLWRTARYLLGSSIKKLGDETLFLELARRGDDLSSLREEVPTAEIVKIGL